MTAPFATTVVVFAKAPVPGLAKTRLIPALGAAGAAALAERFLRHTVAEAVAADLGPVVLYTTPDTTHAAFRALAAQHRVALRVQRGGDLGERMARAFDEVLAGSGAALLVGTDAPALTAQVLREAAAGLAADDAVFVPAADGGYALVGLRRPAPALFAGMRWSHPGVMAETRRRLAALALRHAELPTLADVDEPADLVHVPPAWLPATAGGR